MNVTQIADGLRLLGRANAHYRTSTEIELREVDWKHPLAAAHRRVASRHAVAGRATVASGLTEDIGPWDATDPRTPEDWRREGERAARFLELGQIMAEAMEQNSRRRQVARATRIPVANIPHGRAEVALAEAAIGAGAVA